MSLEWILAVMVTWIAVGIGTAFLFGTFIRRNDISDDVDELAPPTVKHLRPRKRTAQIGVRSQAKAAAEKNLATSPPARRMASNG
jgi:hypothetical protein